MDNQKPSLNDIYKLKLALENNNPDGFHRKPNNKKAKMFYPVDQEQKYGTLWNKEAINNLTAGFIEEINQKIINKLYNQLTGKDK